MVATSEGSPFAVIADEGRRLLAACSSTPRSPITPRGALILRNFDPPHRRVEGRLDRWPPSAPRPSRASEPRSARGAVI